MSAESLSKFYTGNQTPDQRLVFGRPPRSAGERTGGGELLYLPSGQVGLRADTYTQEDFSHPFAGYMSEAFGAFQPVLVGDNEIDRYSGAQIVALHYTPPIVEQARRLGTEMGDVFYHWNDKAYFQLRVQEVLGEEFSTSPKIAEAGTTLSQIGEFAESVKQHGDTQVVVRVADVRQAGSGGKGVLFAENIVQVKSFLEGLGLLDKDTLQGKVLIERLWPNDGSPSTTFYIDDRGVHMMTVNWQIFDASGKNFLASTNVLPHKFSVHTERLLDKGQQMAEAVAATGARGWGGFDWIGIEKLGECNLRETGSTIPEFATQRAANMIEKAGYAEWVFYLGVPYTDTCPDISTALDILTNQNRLFTGAHTNRQDFDQVHAIPLYGMQQGEFDCVFFWKKGSVHHEEGFATINKTLQSLGATRFL